MISEKWWTQGGSNLRPLPCQGSTLTSWAMSPIFIFQSFKISVVKFKTLDSISRSMIKVSNLNLPNQLYYAPQAEPILRSAQTKVLARSRMGKEGVEPSRPYDHRILSPACIPFHHLPKNNKIIPCSITGNKSHAKNHTIKSCVISTWGRASLD